MLEGLKRAQRFRLEDQRGTEINFELPDFLKDNDLNNRNKFRKTKANSSASDEAIEQTAPAVDAAAVKSVPPQPAPRFLNKTPNITATNDNEPSHENRLNSSGSSTTSSSINGSGGGSNSNHYENGEYIVSNGHKVFGTPPPLPPKPKIKPTNWLSINGHAISANVSPTKDSGTTISGTELPAQRRIGQQRANGTNDNHATPHTIYLDQPNSSFV